MGCGCSSQAAAASSPAPQKPCGTCPNGHALQLLPVPSYYDYSTCDICDNDIPKGHSLWSCRECEYDKCIECMKKWHAGQANGAAAQPQAQSSDTPRQMPTLLTRNVYLTTDKCKDLLGTVLEKYNAMYKQKAMVDANVNVGEFVNDVYVHAFGIIHEGSGLGASGDCPFASAHEVDLFHQFCLNVCVAWSEHKMGRDEEKDKDLLYQMSSLCEILYFLDTSAVPLPDEIEKKIKMLQSDALFPHWVDAQTPKGEAALACCVAVGQKWGLGETTAFQKALAALENIQGNHRI